MARMDHWNINPPYWSVSCASAVPNGSFVTSTYCEISQSLAVLLASRVPPWQALLSL